MFCKILVVYFLFKCTKIDIVVERKITYASDLEIVSFNNVLFKSLFDINFFDT